MKSVQWNVTNKNLKTEFSEMKSEKNVRFY